MNYIISSNELYHHGILGMKWGVRRYQNPDGTLTAAGRKRKAQFEAAGSEAAKKAKRAKNNANDYKRDAEKYEKRYSGDEGLKRYKEDVSLPADGFSDEDIRYLRDQDIKEAKEWGQRMYDGYMKDYHKYKSIADKYSNTLLSELTSKDYKVAKKEFGKAKVKN